jgi:septal ring factor EnvC (AmiA/AmiB activator)
MRPRGLRNIRTVQGLTRRDKAGSREQAVAEMARLEHEKARIQREIDVWQQNLRRTEEQFQRVEARLAVVRQAIAESDAQLGQHPAAPAPAPRRPFRRTVETDDEGEPPFTTFSLEY